MQPIIRYSIKFCLSQFIKNTEKNVKFKSVTKNIYDLSIPFF